MMKRFLSLLAVLACLCTLALGEGTTLSDLDDTTTTVTDLTTPEPPVETTVPAAPTQAPSGGGQSNYTPSSPAFPALSYRLAAAEEGRVLLQKNTAYLEGLTQADLDIRMQKTGATLDEYKALLDQTTQDFTDEEAGMIDDIMSFIQRRLYALNCQLPDPGEIVFVKTGMTEEPGAGGYTHRYVIYLGAPVLEKLYSLWNTAEGKTAARLLVAHELFHVVSRIHRGFRGAIYGVLGFSLADKPFEFPAEVAEKIISNPDVAVNDSFASFTVDGKKTDCALIFCADQAFAQPGDTLFSHTATGVVPLDNMGKIYPVNEVPDFWDKVGRNTDYVINAEECAADNFSFAIVYGSDHDYPTPEIIDGILTVLKGYRP